MVLTSVIYALSLAPLLSGIVRVAQSNVPVRHYPTQAIWVGNQFLLILLMWWSLWGFRSVSWTFSDFVFIAVEPVLLFIACSLLYPQRVDGAQVDLKSHFENISGVFYSTTFVLLILVSLDGVVLGIEPAWNVNRYFQAVVLAIIAWAYVDRRANSQLIASILYFIAAIGFVAIRWFSPPG